jgi:hypothetical protein
VSPNLYPSSPYSAPSSPYNAPSSPYNAPVPPLEQIAPPDGKRRSSIVRDVAIGVAIAVLVLSGFLAVKYLILGSEGTSEPSAPTSLLSSVRLSIAGGSTAELFIDGKKIATVADKHEIPVPPGQHTVKLVGPDGRGCEQEMKLEAGKAKTLECTLSGAPAAPPVAPPVAPGAGTGSGSAQPSVGSGSGSAATTGSSDAGGSAAVGGSPAGSAAQGAAQGSTDTRPSTTAPSDHPVPDKTDRMPVEDPKPPAKLPAKPADHPTTTPAASKPPDKTVDRVKPTKPPVEDDPLGRLEGGTKPGEKKPIDDPTLKPLPKVPGDTKGYAAITSTPPARIAIDGKDTGLSTPIAGHALPLAPGKHKITFVISGDKFTFSVVIKAGEVSSMHKDLQ